MPKAELVVCDYCEDYLPKEDATKHKHPGVHGTVTVFVCGDCEGYQP